MKLLNETQARSEKLVRVYRAENPKLPVITQAETVLTLRAQELLVQEAESC